MSIFLIIVFGRGYWLTYYPRIIIYVVDWLPLLFCGNILSSWLFDLLEYILAIFVWRCCGCIGNDVSRFVLLKHAVGTEVCWTYCWLLLCILFTIAVERLLSCILDCCVWFLLLLWELLLFCFPGFVGIV